MLMKIVLTMFLLIGIVYAAVSLDRENPPALRQARMELDNMRGFVFSVNRFVAANHNFNGVATWDGVDGTAALRAAPSTPASLRGVGMPPSWRAVVAEGDYVLCATLSERAVALVGQAMPDSIDSQVLREAGTVAEAVVFAPAGDFEIPQAEETEQQVSAARGWVTTCAS